MQARARWTFQVSQGEEVETLISGETENVYMILRRIYSGNYLHNFSGIKPSFVGDITHTKKIFFLDTVYDVARVCNDRQTTDGHDLFLCFYCLLSQCSHSLAYVAFMKCGPLQGHDRCMRRAIVRLPDGSRKVLCFTRVLF